MSKRLSELLGELPAECAPHRLSGEGADPAIALVADDSRQVEEGALFIAVEGAQRDGRDFLGAAIEKGAVAALVYSAADDPAGELLKHDPRLRPHLEAGFPLVLVRDSRLAASAVALAFYDHPDRELDLVGVTGTNGKTTTASLVRQICQGAGRPAAELGTLGLRAGRDEEYLDLGNTTPGPVTLARTLRALCDQGVEVLAMEVSSHAIHQKRVAGLRFRVAAFTNLTQDHLDYHGTLDAYAETKLSWLEVVARQAEPGAVVLNLDDEIGRKAAERLSGGKARVLTYSMERGRRSDLLAEGGQPVPGGTRAVWTIGGLRRDHVLSLAGQFNVYNALAAAGSALALGVSDGEVLRELSWAGPPPGRFERIDAGQKFTVLVDYAHTPDALENLLNNARAVVLGFQKAKSARDAHAPHAGAIEAGRVEEGERAPRRTGPPPDEADDGDRPPLDPDEAEEWEARRQAGGKRTGGPRLIVLFGAGGDRDRGKRPKMGEVAARLADVVVLTSDNPRSESPEAIIHEVRLGIAEEAEVELHVEADRAKAIRQAIGLARPGDAVVIAGKGAEPYQEIGGERHAFDDRQQAREALEERQRREEDA